LDEVSVLTGEPKPYPSSLWTQALSPRTFPSGRVDVWRVRLDQSERIESAPDDPPTPTPTATVLSPDELARARRFHFEEDRSRFSRCRSALRSLLAEYLSIPAAEVRFEYQPNGKPQLATVQNQRALEFNVSHSGNLALIAVSSERRLGVDIEKIRADVDTVALAERFFSRRERAGLQALADHLRVPAFYACWTRKEAFLKATGSGLSFPLADFSVTTHPDQEPEIEEINGQPEAGKKWYLADLPAIAGYRAALALENDGPHPPIEARAWN